ncbi:TDT family transporter [Acidiphilium multivorum]|uniref:TDT family transporter n=1 Tax=Acidiphilium multivorum TaxID=62140 RepID=UPI001B8C0723|nr:TDT family transporter [Acidiphilium multivorum]MBS3023086.1 TDT family transporter [Acidiphilium multivorum]
MLTQGFARFLRTRRTDLLAIVRQFTPNWFAATMGTGILALDLNQLPGLHRPAMALWLLNIALFALFTLLYAARWLLYPREAARIFGHSVMSMFLGTIPMGLATIINGFIAFGLAPLGPEAVGIATALWWADVALSLVIGIGVPFLMVIRQDHAIERMTAVWLLPVVAAEVAAASGAQIVPHLGNPHLALLVDILSYALWAYSVPVALGIVAVLLLRLVLHRLPHRDMAPSSWLTLGPIGTGALGLLLLGADAQGALAPLGLPGLADAARGIGLIGGVILWGYGVWWLAFAVLATLRYLRGGIPFNLGWWGFTFPLGVYAATTFTLAGQTHLALFHIAAVAMTASLAALWVIVAAMTLRGAASRALFAAPCLLRGAIPEDALTADMV